MLYVNERIQIPDEELTFSYVRSSGPGGQNVNKVASKAVLRWPVVASPSVPPDIKTRFLAQQRNRLTVEGDFMVMSQRYRDQERNREDCLDKVRSMLLLAVEPPRPRKKTKPSRGSKERRLANKRHRSDTKAARRGPAGE
jgi:ribosome-associated protein